MRDVSFLNCDRSRSSRVVTKTVGFGCLLALVLLTGFGAFALKLLGAHAVDAREACCSMVLFQMVIVKPSIIAKVSTVYS